MRPTGKLHLGNYMGALHNWVGMQDKYECYFFIADYHALTTDYADPSAVKQNTLEVAMDFLSAGLDPDRCAIFIQSHVVQHAELHLLLSMITSLGWLERVPSYKEQQENIAGKDLTTYGFLGYPLLQSADILVYKADFVPVGQDQAAHVELTREVARRFNSFYGHKKSNQPPSLPIVPYVADGLHMSPPPWSQLLPEPKALLTPSPKLPGVDGRKMSKSYDNAIYLTDPPVAVLRKVEGMSNGGQRLYREDPGDPDICPVADLHRVFSKPDMDAMIRNGCRSAGISCMDCKHALVHSLEAMLSPIRSRRSEYELAPHKTWDILLEGASKAKNTAEETMKEVRSAMGLAQDGFGSRYIGMFEQFKELGQLKHDLRNKSDWWELPSAVRERKFTEHFIDSVLPRSLTLTHLEDSVFLASRNRRVCLLSAIEGTAGNWIFLAKTKSYEAIVLLCGTQDFKLVSFVLPQKLYRDTWSQVKKTAKTINLEIQKRGDDFFLKISSIAEIKVTDYAENFEALR